MRWMIAILFILAAQGAAAKTFKGHARKAASETLVYNEKVMHFFEQGSNFYLEIDKHAGLYRFPRIPDRDLAVREFLKAKVKSGQAVRLEVNAQNAEILEMGDASP